MESLENINNDSFQKNTKRFLLGILIFSIGATLIFEWYPKTMSGAPINFIQLIGLILFAWYGLKLASWGNITNTYLRIMIVLIIGWELFIVCHGFVFNYAIIKENLFIHNRSMAYLLTLAVFLPVTNTHFLRIVFNYIYKLGLIFLILLPFLAYYILDSQDFAEQYVWILGMSGGFTLLSLFYRPKKEVAVALAVMTLSLLLITIIGRRNIMFSCFNFLIFSLLIIPLLNKKLNLVKKGKFILSFLIAVLLGMNLFISNQNDTFYYLTKRVTDDTRETVFLYYFLDMSDQDLLIGKGLNGTYFCPGIDKAWSGGEEPRHRDLDDRLYIENGFLQLILNGGIIYLSLYLLILIPAIILGLFFSKNLFLKGCAFLIFLFILDMVPFGLPTFSLRHFAVWFCVAICFSKKMRSMNEEDMKLFFNQY